MATMPADADPLPRCPSGHTRSDGIDDACNFMPWNSRVLNAREGAIFRERIAVAYTAGLNLDSDRSGARGRDFTFDELERSIPVSDLHCTHVCHISSD
jgi:hypothetical protein